LKAKRTRENAIWCLIVLNVIIARLDIIAELGWDITDFETVQVITPLERGRAYKMNNILLLELEKDIKALPFLLCFLLVIRVKANFSVSSTLTVISTLGEDIRMRSRL